MDRPLGGPRAKRGPAPQKTPDGAPKGATSPKGDVKLKDSRANRRAVPLAFMAGEKEEDPAGCGDIASAPRTPGQTTRAFPGPAQRIRVIKLALNFQHTASREFSSLLPAEAGTQSKAARASDRCNPGLPAFAGTNGEEECKPHHNSTNHERTPP